MNKRKINRVCVFCGSALGIREAYGEQARLFGQTLAKNGIGLVYGGGGIGIMGAIADAQLEAGGEVIGVIPYALSGKERAHPGVEMRVVNTMHERKALMAELSDGFIALPGGFGTFDELFEIVTWAQLNIHHKPIGLLNIAGYFDPLLNLIDSAITEGFVLPHYRQLLIVTTDTDDLLAQMASYEPLDGIVQWIEMNET